MRLGILEMVGLAATLVFAIPLGILGVQFLLDGRTTFGGILLLVAALMVLLPRYLTMPQDVPGMVAEKTIGSVVTDADEESER